MTQRDRGSKPREIRAELDRTRASLDRAFDALGSRLTPSSLLWDGIGVFRDGASAGVSRAMQMAQQHPLPACVIGIGVGWLLLENARSGRGDGTYRGTPAEQAAGGYASGRYGTYPGTPAEAEEFIAAGYSVEPSGGSAVRQPVAGAVQKAGEVASRAGERVSETAEAVKEKAGRAAETVKEQASQAAGAVRQQTAQAVDTVREQAAHTAEAVKTRASRVGQQARQTAQRAGSEFDHLLREQPLVVGLGAMAVGVLAGLLLPSTRREDEVLGEVRDRKLDAARTAARETLEKGKQVARTAVESARQTVKEEAERQQLTPRAVVDRVVGAPSPQPPASPPAPNPTAG
jgi:ElaB/YqjD/DUF883 family membrane-anchored ribosome-binding protein